MVRAEPALPDGFRLLTFDTIRSTNALALDMAREGEAGGLWLRADRQTGGRGRQGRVWTSEPGNLHASLLLIDPAPRPRLAELPLVVAVAVHEAVAGLIGPAQRAALAIKWPNDLLHDGAKLSGILIEGIDVAGGRAVVVGIGVNLAHHPADTPYPATDLAAIGFPVAPDEMLVRLAHRLDGWLDRWRTEGFAPVRQAWLARARGLGEPIRVRLPRGDVAGRFEALDDEGRLLLRLASGGLVTVSAGDVFFGPAAGG